MVTDEQMGLMTHTVKHEGRNYFAAEPGGHDALQFEDLIEKGYAWKRNTPSWMSAYIVYALTEDGKRLVKARGTVR